MPRYFFDVHGQAVERDQQGQEFGNPDDAKRYARVLAQALVVCGVKADPTNMEVVVRDDNGEVFRLTVSADHR